MSLDVYLRDIPITLAGTGVFMRDGGRTREIPRLEWDTHFPGCEPVAATIERRDIFKANLTHHLCRMAQAAGVYHHLWHPEEIGVETAGDLVGPLTAGLTRLQADPQIYHAYNPRQGCGSYEELVDFLLDYLEACKANPSATVRACR